MFKTHLAFGFLFALLALKFIEFKPIFFIPLVCFFSVIPDIDLSSSKVGGRRFVSKAINFFFGHRGIIHSIFPPILLFMLFWYLNVKIASYAALFGYFSHLLMDGFTIRGINFLNPFLDLRLNGFVETGTLLETVFFVLILFVDIVYGFIFFF